MKLKQHHINKLNIIYNRIWKSTGSQTQAYVVRSILKSSIVKNNQFNLYYYAKSKNRIRTSSKIWTERISYLMKDPTKTWTKKQVMRIIQQGINKGLITRPEMVYDRPKYLHWKYQGPWDVIKSYEKTEMMETRNPSPD